MDLLIRPDGSLACIYAEAVDLSTLGQVQIQRASHVEPDPQGHWHADLAIVGGPVLGPFERRSQALAAEQAWLEAHWLV